ncbi:hypothetical protein BTRA_756 [Burkholderia thailandensis USAMRU Malaysia |nr:hypothetical protein BTQ_3063 [Burkholderia thailandensis 2002721723]AHI77951.1 hypothetical protein BTJ_2635 [Burkholderia thailandensis E444]AIC88303.1 hypothetical protein BTRA_756 [Burkholderia thailandensis USAMRU Malaysia \
MSYPEDFQSFGWITFPKQQPVAPVRQSAIHSNGLLLDKFSAWVTAEIYTGR